MFSHVRTIFIAAFTMLGFAVGAQAANVVGSSGLLNVSDANRIESWLGQGSVQFDNVFTKVSGSNSYDFHAAADGKGDTISIFSVSFGNGQQALIGGYNPTSWNGTLSNYTNTMAGGAFLFNLTNNTVLQQTNQFQTYNNTSYGPTFGGGHDIYVDSSLNNGYAYQYSYGGNGSQGGRNVLGLNTVTSFTINSFEVFTVSPIVSAVPEPETYAMLLAGLGVMGAVARRRKAKQA